MSSSLPWGYLISTHTPGQALPQGCRDGRHIGMASTSCLGSPQRDTSTSVSLWPGQPLGQCQCWAPRGCSETSPLCPKIPFTSQMLYAQETGLPPLCFLVGERSVNLRRQPAPSVHQRTATGGIPLPMATWWPYGSLFLKYIMQHLMHKPWVWESLCTSVS